MNTIYTVRSGDTLSALAQRMGLSESALMRANGMDPALADGRFSNNARDPDRLMVGQTLKIPSATPGYERQQQVRAGDTLSAIADQWGVSLPALLAANPQFDPTRADGTVETARGASGTWDPDALRIGDIITRPGAGAPGATPQPGSGGTGPATGPATGPTTGPNTGPNTRPTAGAASGVGNDILDGMVTTGASARTAGQDSLPGGGVDASRTMARTDEARVMRYADRLQAAAERYDLPPAILAGIASRESRGGNALDRNGYGDAGHGFGLMQVDDRNPGLTVATAGGPFGQAHIDQAASILRAKLDAVQRAYPDLSPQDQMQLAVSRYNGGRGVPGDFDRGTTGGDYSADVIARSQYYAQNWPGGTASAATPAAAAASATAAAPAAAPAAAARAGLPDTSNLTQAERFDLYAQQIAASGNDAARADLAAGRRVVLGLRVDTPVNANNGVGAYDDRIVVLWQDGTGARHVQEFSAATEPASTYYERGYGADINGDGRRELGRLAEGTIMFDRGSTSRFAQALIPVGSPTVQRDTNHDNRIGGNDGASRTGSDFLFHAGGRNGYTGSAGCQTIPPAQWADFWGALGNQQRFNYVLTNVTPR